MQLSVVVVSLHFLQIPRFILLFSNGCSVGGRLDTRQTTALLVSVRQPCTRLHLYLVWLCIEFWHRSAHGRCECYRTPEEHSPEITQHNPVHCFSLPCFCCEQGNNSDRWLFGRAKQKFVTVCSRSRITKAGNILSIDVELYTLCGHSEKSVKVSPILFVPFSWNDMRMPSNGHGSPVREAKWCRKPSD